VNKVHLQPEDLPSDPEKVEAKLSAPTGSKRVAYWRLLVAVALIGLMLMFGYIAWHLIRILG